MTGDDEDDEEVAAADWIKDAGLEMEDVACLLIVPTSGGAGTIKRILVYVFFKFCFFFPNPLVNVFPFLFCFFVEDTDLFVYFFSLPLLDEHSDALNS